MIKILKLKRDEPKPAPYITSGEEKN